MAHKYISTSFFVILKKLGVAFNHENESPFSSLRDFLDVGIWTIFLFWAVSLRGRRAASETLWPSTGVAKWVGEYLNRHLGFHREYRPLGSEETIVRDNLAIVYQDKACCDQS